MAIPVALWLPLLILILMASLELGVTTVRHTVLERSLDEAVREVRLGTGRESTHSELKTLICDAAPVLYGCEENLRLEMITNDLRDWHAMDSGADCADSNETARPLRNFEYGGDNELMILRACYMFNPITPATAFGDFLVKNDNGFSALVATSAFVQEPR